MFGVSDSRIGDHAYFRALNAQLEAGGYGAMLYDLQRYELAEWHPRSSIPQTAARNEQKAATLGGLGTVFLDLLRAGQIPGVLRGGGWVFVSTTELQIYATQRLRGYDVTLNQIGELMSHLGFEKDNRGRPRGFLVPPLPDARRAWDETMILQEWNDTSEWAEIETRTGYRPLGEPPF